MKNDGVSYSEHMRWCKERALAYVEREDLQNALASMASDVRKHPATDNHTVNMLIATEGMRCVMAGDAVGMRRLIEGFAV